jgi:deferrochelatase/peroxidase EfeB
MRFETWDRTSLREQEAVVGRTKREGAPLSGGKESTEPDFALKGSDGPLVPADSHVALAHPSRNRGVRMLRRGFNYTDGSDGLGRLDAGLFFIAFVTDPRTHSCPCRRRWPRTMRWPSTSGTPHRVCSPSRPGLSRAGWLGQGLFAAA